MKIGKVSVDLGTVSKMTKEQFIKSHKHVKHPHKVYDAVVAEKKRLDALAEAEKKAAADKKAEAAEKRKAASVKKLSDGQ